MRWTTIPFHGKWQSYKSFYAIKPKYKLRARTWLLGRAIHQKRIVIRGDKLYVEAFSWRIAPAKNKNTGLLSYRTVSSFGK